MKSFLHSRDAASKGAALMIVLAFVVLLTGVALAYFNRTTTDRQLAQSSYTDTSSDLLARSALDIIVSDLKREIVNNPTVSVTNIQPTTYGTPSAGQTPIPNLLRRSFSGDPTNLTSSVNSTAVSANGRAINLSRWNSHYLIPRANPANTSPDSSPVASFTAPDWVLVNAQGPAPAPTPSSVIGRYAFAVYDESGLLDMNLAGYPGWSGSVNPNPVPSPTPWQTNVGRKGNIAFADLTALPAAPATTLSQTQINNIVGWRNFATTQQNGSFASSNFNSGNMRNRQDAWGTYLLDFGDPPYSTPCPVLPFTSVDPSTQSNRTDQAFLSRQQLLKLQSSLNVSQNALQYMGTFSRERNQPARDWNRLNNRLPDRYDLGTLGMVKPNPAGSWAGRVRGSGHGNGGFRGRGHYKGDALVIRDRFGLAWVPGDTTITDPHNVNYWGHWFYVGAPGMPPNSNPHIPILRGPASRNDLFQILDFAMTQANADADDIDPINVADVYALGASLIDQYDAGDPGQPDDDADPRTGTHITIIKTGSGLADFVLGWESVGAPNGEAKAAGDATDNNSLAPKNPYNWITNDGTATGAKKTPPPAGFTPIVLNHAFSNPGDIGYGLRPEYATNRFQRLDFHTANPNASLLDFFTYNPVDHNYPRLGVVNLNTKHVPVLAAVLQNALKKDIDTASLPNPFPVVSSFEATAAAQAIVNATNPDVGGTRATSRADIGRLTAAAASAIGIPAGLTVAEQEKVPEVIARALSEVGQTRTWNLMIDVVAQTGRYKPNAPDLSGSNFIVEGEKRCWLHVALGRDLRSGQVDVLGTQLEEVTE
jgi:hypothetical protein